MMQPKSITRRAPAIRRIVQVRAGFPTVNLLCLRNCPGHPILVIDQFKQYCGHGAVSNLKDSAQHTKDAAGANISKNMAEAKQHLKSGEHPELEAKKQAAKSQEKASTAAAKGHATDVSYLWSQCLDPQVVMLVDLHPSCMQP